MGRLIFGRLNLGNEKDVLDLEDDEDLLLDEVEDDLPDDVDLLDEVDELDLIHRIVGEAWGVDLLDAVELAGVEGLGLGRIELIDFEIVLETAPTDFEIVLEIAPTAPLIAPKISNIFNLHIQPLLLKTP